MKVVGNIASDSEVVATADGAITAGKPVVVNADGTVSVVVTTSATESIGSPTVFESGTTENTSATFDSNSNKIVIAYTDNDNGGYGTAIVGTVSDTSISYGTPVVFESAITSQVSAVFDSSNNKVVVAYTDQGNGYQGRAVVGTVDASNNSISFGYLL